MPRPKDDADRLKKSRDESRKLLEGFPGGADDDFDEISEVTRPDIQIHVNPAVQRDEQRLLQEPPVPPHGGKSPSHAALDALPGTLEAIPKNQRLWALVAILIAALAAYAISRGVWG